MAAYRRVYDSHHLQADCQEPGSTPEPLPEYGLPLPFNAVKMVGPHDFDELRRI